MCMYKSCFLEVLLSVNIRSGITVAVAQRLSTCSLVGVGCWFFVREKYCWLAGLSWLKPTSEQSDGILFTLLFLFYLSGSRTCKSDTIRFWLQLRSLPSRVHVTCPNTSMQKISKLTPSRVNNVMHKSTPWSNRDKAYLAWNPS